MVKISLLLTLEITISKTGHTYAYIHTTEPPLAFNKHVSVCWDTYACMHTQIPASLYCSSCHTEKCDQVVWDRRREKNSLCLSHHTWLLQEVNGDLGPSHLAQSGVCQFQVLAKSGRVVIDACFGIPKCLHDRIYLQNLVLQVPVWGLRDSVRH